VTFIASDAIPAGSAAVVLLCGQKEQSIEVESIRVLRYPATTDVSKFPRAKLKKRSYAGREADAPWRKAALERIEKHRKADLSMTVMGDDGKPVANSEVKLSLHLHAFGFGTAVVAKRLSGESEDDKRYREIIDRLFSIVVFENDLKDGNWSPDFDAKRKPQRNAELNQAFAWLGERHIPVRGHYLMQVATPYNLHDIKDSAVIRERTLASVKERLKFVKDRVVEWDVINHPIAWNGADMLNKRPGLEQLDRDVFNLARSLTKLPFCVNEDQVFRPGPQCDDTLTYIQALNAAGLTVHGLGNQAHFHESYLPAPEHLLEVTGRFAKVVPHQCITEYDIVTTEDEELAADYTRDVLIAVFSHPAYTSFLLWGFWEGSHWKPEAASWNKDWSIRKRGEVLEEWIGSRWRTEVTLKTDANGRVQ
jgi:GH35 family endo-1,4-beta-xylanase